MISNFKRSERLRVVKALRLVWFCASLFLFALNTERALAAPGDVYVSEFGSGSVLRIGPSGSPTVFASGLTGPFGLAFDRAGNLYVADKDSKSVFKYTPGGAKSTFASNITLPTALAFDATGNLFVADFSGNAILKFTPDGNRTTFASGLHNPSGLGFDRNGNVYQSDYATGTLFKYSPQGTKTTFATGFNKPEAIAFDLGGNLFVSDNTAGTITKFAPTGTRTVFASDLNGAWGLAFDDAGNLLEADSLSNNIFAFASDGAKTTRAPAISTPTFIAIEPPTASPLNISTRMHVLQGDNAMIAGFIIVGNAPKKVLVRGMGPSLSAFGVTGVLDDPTLELHAATTVTNDNWKTASDGSNQQGEIDGTGLSPANDKEAAVLVSLAPGSYTVVERGKDDTAGVGLVELYDLDGPENASLGNISTRGFVETDNNVMIAGFIIGAGNDASKILVRGLGPSLKAFGIGNALEDPFVELREVNGALLSSNDNWQDSAADAVRATTIPPGDDLESAIVTTLPSGNYTAILSGKNGGTGIGLIEVYNLQSR